MKHVNKVYVPDTCRRHVIHRRIRLGLYGLGLARLEHEARSADDADSESVQTLFIAPHVWGPAGSIFFFFFYPFGALKAKRELAARYRNPIINWRAASTI